MADIDAIWHVYRVRNFTRREVFFAAAQDPGLRITFDHAAGKTAVVRHWRWDDDDISWRSLSMHESREQAERAAADREQGAAPDGWTHIRVAV